jgi:UDP-N-acetylmuramoylalanine--D-glutamate ligase
MMAESIVPQELSGRDGAAGRTLVLGMGVTGAACARYLAARGEAPCFADSRAEPPGLAAIRETCPDAQAITGGFPVELPPGVNRLVVSPGVPLDLPILQAARAAGLPVASDIDLFVEEARAPLIAITGSNGKSTVTSMVGQILAVAGWRVGVGGNLGTPALDLLRPDVRAYVLELSSFQLERSRPVPSAAAVILNISADHLDLHGDMAAYVAAKARIYMNTRLAVINRDAPELAALLPAGVPVVSFGLGVADDNEFGLRAMPDGLWLTRGWDLIVPAAQLQVTGRHNLANALAALALCTGLGVRPEAAAEGLRAFRPLPHRMAIVATTDGVTWIDDSKATNVGAAVASIGSTDGPLVLIAGGDGKGADFDALAVALAGRTCSAVLLGRDREPVAAALAGTCEVIRVDSIDEAVLAAGQIARPGWTVLLAPACSSLDMFRDYAARGDAFREAVRRLTGGLS